MVRLRSPQVLLSPVGAKGGTVLTLPFGPTPRHRNGHCTRLRKNWSNGQSNFASHCAMLRMENIQMRSGSPPAPEERASEGELRGTDDICWWEPTPPEIWRAGGSWTSVQRKSVRASPTFCADSSAQVQVCICGSDLQLQASSLQNLLATRCE
jgi:hypothetical protein